MADQVEVTKLTELVAIGPPADVVSVPKLVVYLMLEAGEADDTSNRQGHVHAQIIRR